MAKIRRRNKSRKSRKSNKRNKTRTRTRRTRRRNIMKTLNTRVLPAMNTGLHSMNTGLNSMNTGLKTVGKTALPIVEKGVSAVYGTMATGFDLGVKGVKGIK